MHVIPVGSVLDGRVLGVCIIEYLEERKKSAEPPKPFNIREPITHVLLACAYMSISTGVFIPITPNRRMISGELETC